MKTRQGYVQGDNAQAIVTADQCIVSAEITQQENDVHQLVPMLGPMEATLDAAGIEERHGLQGLSPSRHGGGPVGMVADLRLL